MIQSIFTAICAITPNARYCRLNATATGASIYFFNTKAISIYFSSRAKYIRVISEKGELKPGFNRPAIRFDFQDASVVDEAKDAILAAYDYCKSIIDVDSFGCCNDFVKCSDARACIHQDDLFYLGCQYRKNLEEGRIFYGHNANIPRSSGISMDFVSFDVECACNGSKAGGLCAIGACLVNDNRIVDTFYTLVNPEMPFDPIPQKVHGIHTSDVVDAPAFPQLISVLPPWFFQFPLVAHNASSDCSVLYYAAKRYQVDIPSPKVYCTLLTAKKYLHMDKYNLPKVADALGIPQQQHHHALADAKACAEIAIHFLQHNQELVSYQAKEYDTVSRQCTKPSTKMKITIKLDNDDYAYPDLDYSFDPITFNAHYFVFTGTIPGIQRKEAQEMVTDHGGMVAQNPSARSMPCYLVVGEEPVSVTTGQDGKSQKILIAENLIKERRPIKIIRADHFVDCLKNQ